MARLTIAAALALLAAPLHAGVEVTAVEGRISVSAAQAPLSDVLDGLARNTRMKIVYEGGLPRNPVTLELRGRTPAEAVLGVLEGLGLNYALALDLSGTQVETLMIVGEGGPGSPTVVMGATGSAGRARGRREIVPDAQEDDGSDGEQPMAYEPPASSPLEVFRAEEAAAAAAAAAGIAAAAVVVPAPGPRPQGSMGPLAPAGPAPMVPGPPLVGPSPNPSSPPNH